MNQSTAEAVIAICVTLCVLAFVGGCTTSLINRNNQLFGLEMEKLKHPELKQD